MKIDTGSDKMFLVPTLRVVMIKWQSVWGRSQQTVWPTTLHELGFLNN